MALRETYWGIPGYAIFAVLVTLALGIFSYRVARLYRLLRLGQGERRWDRLGHRIGGALGRVLGQVCVLKDVALGDRAGLGHFIIFYGFLTFSLSYILLIGDGFKEDLTATVLSEPGARAFSLLLDILGAIVLLAVAWALGRRYLARPQRLEPSRDAVIILGIIASLMVASFFTEAFDLVLKGSGYTLWAPISSGLGRLFQDMEPGTAGSLFRAAWWLHLALILTFLAYIPYSKHLHILVAPFNVLFRSLAPKGALASMDLEKAENYGVSRIQEFSWRGLLDLYACTECARCRENCCTYVSQKPLSPKKLILDLKKHLLAPGGEAKAIIGNSVAEEEVWGCTTCRYCQENCPVAIEHVDKIVGLRRNLVLAEGRMPDDVMQALRCIETRGHPWRGTMATRTDWAEGLDVKTAADAEGFQLLYWVGCTAALEERNQKVARALAGIMKEAGVDFAILGAEEVCCGEPARRLGNEYLYQTLVKSNIQTLERYKVSRIVTACPHCFNTIKNEYPQFGGHFQVMHHSQLLADLMAQGRIKPRAAPGQRLTYHDPCYLGRYNGIYDTPRSLLASLAPGAMAEMRRRRSKALCCGGGGGHLWMEEATGARINQMRTQDALDTGAGVVATACPYCLAMFEDGIKGKGAEERLKALDLAEILAGNL